MSKFECKANGCTKRFETEKGMNVHFSAMHDFENTRVTKTCPGCGESFTVGRSESDQECCSRQCSADYRFRPEECVGGE